MSGGLVALCCSVLAAEVRHLQSTCWPEMEVRPQSSMLHMEPCRLAQKLEAEVDTTLAGGSDVLLVYGDCCHSMLGLEGRPHVARTHGANCCDLLLGHETYRELAAAGVFFLIPEWARRWREVLDAGLQMRECDVQVFMQEMQTRLLYLDTGLVPIPKADLAACSRYCGLPWDIRTVTLDTLRGRIEEALVRLHEKEPA